MKFLYNEDLDFFIKILGDNFNENLFDFRDPVIKRKEFDKMKKDLFKKIVLSRQNKCQLCLTSQCGGKKLVLDHMIPLSSNELNKYIRGEKGQNGKKAIAQSFGSNHPDNLLLSCEHCNNHKKHKFIARDKNGKFEIVDVSSVIK